ncbi:hypothetical protein [Nostoc sp.]
MMTLEYWREYRYASLFFTFQTSSKGFETR